MALKTILSCSALNFVTKHLSDQDLLQLTLKILPRIKRAGFDYLELYLRQIKEADLEPLLSAVQQQDLQIYSIHYCKPLLNRELSEGIKLLIDSLRVTAVLGATLGVLHPPTKYLSPAGSIELCRQVLEQALPIAEELEIILTLENLAGPGYLESFAQLLEEYPSDYLGVTMDLKFLHAAGYNMEEYFRVLGHKIVNIHVNDFTGDLLDATGKRQYPELGSGHVDFGFLSNLLLSYHYQGVLTLESAFAEDCGQQIRQARTLMLALVK